jgi:hypothetical protein
MELNYDDFNFVGIILEGFLFGEISVLQLPHPLSKRLIPGIYSGIFAMHVQYHASKEGDNINIQQKIVFYALCVLYVLSVVVNALDIATFPVNIFVRK